MGSSGAVSRKSGKSSDLYLLTELHGTVIGRNTLSSGCNLSPWQVRILLGQDEVILLGILNSEGDLAFRSGPHIIVLNVKFYDDNCISISFVFYDNFLDHLCFEAFFIRIEGLQFIIFVEGTAAIAIIIVVAVFIYKLVAVFVFLVSFRVWRYGHVSLVHEFFRNGVTVPIGIGNPLGDVTLKCHCLDLNCCRVEQRL